MSLLGADVRLSSSVLQVSSLVTYSLFLVPGLNLVLPGVVFLALYIHLHRHRLFQQPDPRPRKALLVVPGLLLLLLINLVFMTNTELTIYQGAKQQQPGESQWTFGQTLALLLLSLPIRDTALLEFYRRDSARRITLEKLTRSIALGDVDTVARMVSRQEVNVNIKIKGGYSFMLSCRKLNTIKYRESCDCTSVCCQSGKHVTCSTNSGPERIH
jgi:hypothetical protein